MPEAASNARCPDDGSPLGAGPDGLPTCKRCGGALCGPEDLNGWAAGSAELLSVETRQDSGAFVRTRQCPACAKPMVPLRIGRLDGWVERCPSCESLWVDRQDRRSLELLVRQQARKDAYATFTVSERKEMAEDLAHAAAPTEPPLSPFHHVLAIFGLPVVTRTEGAKTPWATWGLALVLVLAFLAARLAGDGTAVAESFGYHSEDPRLLAAVTACFVHEGWLHLLGNVYFLFAFGDGVEQRVPRPVLLLGFVGAGALANVVQGWSASGSQLIFGASGAIAALMGACVLLQPRAKVLTAVVGLRVLPIPLWLYGVFELAYQGVMASAGVPGVAWVAHLTGLGLGLLTGFAVSRLTARSAASSPAPPARTT